jgi:hypothetical protein
MIYPSLEEVDAADAAQLAYWWRFLPEPGELQGFLASAWYDYKGRKAAQCHVLWRIGSRLDALRGLDAEGGLVPELLETTCQPRQP